MSARTAWPYDADRDDPLTKLRIPAVSAWAEWNYIVAFDRESPARPDDVEAQQLASFLGYYIDYWYNESYKLHLAERPFDIDGGANGMTFRKYADSDWAYRRRTWTMGPLFVPQPPTLTDRSFGPLALPALFDHIYSGAAAQPHPKWAKWKADRPDVFPA